MTEKYIKPIIDMRISFSFLLFLLATVPSFSQFTNNLQLPTSINTDGTPPDSSAILDVQSTTQGMLVPRMTTAQRTDIASPANGLLVFDTDMGGFLFFQGGWQSLSGGGADDQTLTFDSTSNELSIENGNAVDLTPLVDKERDYSDFYHFPCDTILDFSIDTISLTVADCGNLYDSGGESGSYSNNENETFGINTAFSSIIPIYTRVILHSLDIEVNRDTLFIGGNIFIDNVISPDTLLFDGSSDLTIRFKSDNVNTADGFHISWDKMYYQGGNSTNPNRMGFFYNAEQQAIGGGVEQDGAWSKVGSRATLFGYGSQAPGFSSSAVGRSNHATGSNSSAFGCSNNATESSSSAVGTFNEAAGSNSNAFGLSNEATGSSSIAFGFGNEATGSSSNAFGRTNDATGNSSSAFGFFNDATGSSSSAFGHNTIANLYQMMAVGIYNDTLSGSATSWVATDPSFVIGNGQNFNNRSTAVTVLKNGNVGIGTANPEELLHINGKIKIGTFETLADGGNATITINSYLLPETDNSVNLGSSDFRWHEVFAANGTINTSDKRDKTNIQDLSYGLKEILQLRPVSYQWKNSRDNEQKLGLIAQELLHVLPEVVKTHDWMSSEEENGDAEKVELERLGVYYSDIIPVLVKAIQEQQVEIDELKLSNNRMAELEKEMEELKKWVGTIPIGLSEKVE